MKVAFPLFLIAVAVVLAWCATADRHDAQPASPEAESTAQEPIVQTAPVPSRERPRLPSLVAASGQEKPAERFGLDRRPRDPEMDPEVYKYQVKLFDAWDGFLEKTGISDAKAQAVLMILHEYQETARHVRKQHLDRIPYPDKWEQEYRTGETWWLGQLVQFEAEQALADVLTSEELEVFSRHLEAPDVYVWLLLKWPYAPPLIVPVDD